MEGRVILWGIFGLGGWEVEEAIDRSIEFGLKFLF